MSRVIATIEATRFWGSSEPEQRPGAVDSGAVLSVVHYEVLLGGIFVQEYGQALVLWAEVGHPRW